MAAGSIARKLTGLSVVSSVTALLLAGVAFVAYDVFSMRETLASRVKTEARIVAYNSASSVVFRDADAAAQTLAAMQEESGVLCAGILAGGTLLATYARDGQPVAAPVVADDVAESHVFESDHLWVYEPIAFEGQRLGTLFIQADLDEIKRRFFRYAAIVVLVSGAAILLTIFLSRRLQKGISRPILDLADAARVVSTHRDYAVRAPGGEAQDELGLLVRTFNEMLAEIQTQHKELDDARWALERRVEERTRELATANKELEAFSYSVSHDLRAPLRAIDGFSKALGTTYESQLDDRGRHFLARIRAGTQRMSELIDDLLLLARVTRAELVRAPMNLSEIAQTIGDELGRRDPTRVVHFEVKGGMTVSGDSHLLRIVLENLLGNAWKFTGKEPAPRIEVGEKRLEDAKLRVFFVRDNGAGFDMAMAGRLFGAFQRLHDEKDYEGTGIGLATVQRIIVRHGGRIWAESEPGKGATFFFTLGDTA